MLLLINEFVIFGNTGYDDFICTAGSIWCYYPSDSRKRTIGPNDWIRILVKIEGYSGGEIQWSETKPDRTITDGKFSNLQGIRQPI